jgi:dual-specificity kinase
MQSVLSHPVLPPMLSYPRQSLNGVPTSIGLPTPPIATRKRKRAHQFTVSYSEVQEVDREGRLREVLVIEDTPPPSTASPATSRHTHMFSASYQPPAYSAPIRTRARAAAEAQALSATTSSTAVLPPPPAKKRKRDNHDEAPRPPPKKTLGNGLQASGATKAWAPSNGSTTTKEVCDSAFSIDYSFSFSSCSHRPALHHAMIRKVTTLLSQMT